MIQKLSKQFLHCRLQIQIVSQNEQIILSSRMKERFLASMFKLDHFFRIFPHQPLQCNVICLCNLLQISFALFKYQYYKHRKIQVEITDCWFCIHVQFCCVFLMFYFPLQLFSTVHQCMYKMLTVLYFWNKTADQVNAIFKCLGIFCCGTDFLTTS